jgi:zinc/manganese transport system permease protein
LAAAIALLASYIGLLLSYHYSLPSGPAIILVAGGFYIISVVFGPQGGIVQQTYTVQTIEP